MTRTVTMKTVSISDLKAHLSRYVREVRRGGEVQVLNRGVPVARLTGLEGPGDAQDRRQRLIASGVVRAGTGDASTLLAESPLKLDGSLCEALLDEREERL
jgi:prevent-host-death family protein